MVHTTLYSYKYLRHPSYVGFFYWSIGTQMLLCNTLSMALFSVASWFFFKRRIPYEEETLYIHFGDDYHNYVQNSWMGLPFIKGFQYNKEPFNHHRDSKDATK